MAKVGEAVAGSTEPIDLTVTVDGAALDLTGYTVVGAQLMIGDEIITAEGDVEKDADQVTNRGHVQYTPDAADLQFLANTLPHEPEKNWIRILVRDGANVLKHFPRTWTDWIDVSKAA